MARTFSLAWFLLGLCLSRPALADKPTSMPRPTTQQVQQTVARAIGYLESENASWLKTRKCAACHHAPMAIWALGEAERQGYAIDKKFLTDTVESLLGSKDKLMASRIFPNPAEKPDPRPQGRGLNMGLPFLAVAAQSLPSLTKGQQQSLQLIAEEIVRKQQPDGSWEFFATLRRPPINESQTTDAAWIIMALEGQMEPTAPKAQREALTKAVAWLDAAKRSDIHQDKAMKVLLAVRSGKPRKSMQSTIDELLALQRADGGWSQTVPELRSDAFATGQTLYVLSLAGFTADQPPIKRGIDFLVATQKPDGSWPVLSRSSPDGSPGSSKLLSPIICAASSWATLGLARLVPKEKPASKADADHKAQKTLLAQILSLDDSVDRAALIAKLLDKDLQRKLTALLPEIERAVKVRRSTLALEAQIKEVGGKLICTQSGPQWLSLATGGTAMEIFDIPTTIDLYNGNNPLKGKGGRNEQVTDAWLKRLSGVNTLRRLDLANCAVQGDGLQHIAALTSLRELNLTLTPIKDDALKHLGGLTELRVLGLASTQCNGTGFQHLRALKKLENVNFHFTPLNDEGLRAITQVPISGRLWFAHTRFSDEGAASLKNLTHLKRCGIGSTVKGSSGEAVAALTKLPLEDLALLDNQASPVGLVHAAKIATLRKLDVSHAPTVKDESMQLVAQMPALEEFKLGSAQVTDDGLLMLAASKSLKKVSLSGLKGITPLGIEKLRKAQPKWMVEVQ